jgi:FkbM family methyltransferase
LAPDGRQEVTVRAVFGTVRCFEDDLLTSQLKEFGAHTRPELAFLSSVVEPTDRIFDLGAHVGTFSIPLARRVAPAGCLIAVEAQSDYFRLLTANVEANGLIGTVSLINALLAPTGKRYVAAHEHANSMATHFVRAKLRKGVRDVRICGIDDLAAEHGVPDVVKIDIEGLELDVLETSELVRTTRPILYTEVSEPHLGRYSRTVQEFNDFLLGLDYRLFRNVGERNAAHDDFRVQELPDLFAGGRFFDVLAVPRDSPRRLRLVEH